MALRLNRNHSCRIPTNVTKPTQQSRSTNYRNIIDEIAEYLAPDLAEVNDHLARILDSDTELVREVGHYVLSTRGKRLRPILAILAAKVFRYVGEDHTKVATALELVHSATLLHDDVIDKAPLRRGKPTVNARWGEDVAILIADYLFSHAFNLALQTSMSPKVLSLICQVTARMCEGEMFQIEKRDALLTRDDYLRIVRGKTAYLFSACTALGSLLANAPEQQVMLLSSYGLNFGIASTTLSTSWLVITRSESRSGPTSATENKRCPSFTRLSKPMRKIATSFSSTGITAAIPSTLSRSSRNMAELSTRLPKRATTLGLRASSWQIFRRHQPSPF